MAAEWKQTGLFKGTGLPVPSGQHRVGCVDVIPDPFLNARPRRAKKGLVKWSVPIGEHLPRKSRRDQTLFPVPMSKKKSGLGSETRFTVPSLLPN